MTTIRPTPPWETIDPDTRAALEEQTPAHLQRLMYGPEVDHSLVPRGQFAADVARADEWLTGLCEEDPDAARVFRGLTFADATWSGQHEYYLCDALVEWGEARHFDGAGVWSLPVLRDLVGRYDEE
jgi:hypothetical protein